MKAGKPLDPSLFGPVGVFHGGRLRFRSILQLGVDRGGKKELGSFSRIALIAHLRIDMDTMSCGCVPELHLLWANIRKLQSVSTRHVGQLSA